MNRPIYLLIFFLVQSFNSSAQVSQLNDVTPFLKETAAINKKIFLNFEKSTSNTNALDGKELAEVLEPVINGKLNIQDRALSKQYVSVIKSYFLSMGQFGNAMEGMFLSEEDNVPFAFGKYKNALTFCQNGIFAENTYNTINSTSDQRALKVADEIILPGLSNFKPLLAIANLDYFCLNVAYTVHDFTGESARDKDSETLAIIIPRQVLQNYLDAKANRQDVLKSSILYNFNKTTGAEPRLIALK